MKREFLEKFEVNGVKLPKEVIDSIMNEHGNDIETSKKDLAAITAERDGFKTQIAERDKDLKSLTEQAGNSEALNKQFTDLQEKYNTDTAGFKEQLSKQARDHASEKFFDGIEFASDRIKNSVVEDFKKQDFKFNEETKMFQGGKEWLEELMKNEPASFNNSKTENSNKTDNSGIRLNTAGSHLDKSEPDYDSMSDAEYYAAKAKEKTQ